MEGELVKENLEYGGKNVNRKWRVEMWDSYFILFFLLCFI